MMPAIHEAEPLLREALEGLDELKGKQHPDALAAASHLSGLLLHLRHLAVCQNLVPLVNIKIAGKWMFIPLKMVLIGIDP